MQPNCESALEVLRFHCGPSGTHKSGFLRDLINSFHILLAYTDPFELVRGEHKQSYCNKRRNGCDCERVFIVKLVFLTLAVKEQSNDGDGNFYNWFSI